MKERTLNDSTIREAMLTKLQKRQPDAILEELRVHNGNAIADIVALHEEAHCYEIKGATDKIERVKIQANFYNPSFRRITLVTTCNHLAKALEIVPRYWGVVLAEDRGTSVKLTNVRASRINPEFDKEKALQMLWKSEMLEMLPSNSSGNKRQPREKLAQMISKVRKKAELSNMIKDALISRRSI